MVKIRRKLWVIYFILAIISIFNISAYKSYALEDYVYLGGIPAGFSLYTRGVNVVGVCDVITDKGLVSPAKKADINIGDRILFIDELEINSASDIEKALDDDEIKIVTIKRKGEIIIEKIKPARDMGGHNKLGVFVQDEINGIGTITFIKDNRFASLGHPILEENNEILSINGGNLFNCNIAGIVKGERGKAGELRGVFLRNKLIAKIDKNCQSGVYGSVDAGFDKNNLKKISIGKAKVGDATIVSTIDGNNPKEYAISIVKVDNNTETKNFVIKVDDKELLDKTGGIVQGQSGSPILQNGKLVGAVTHVFINDSSRGFGISVQNMLNDL